MNMMKAQFTRKGLFGQKLLLIIEYVAFWMAQHLGSVWPKKMLASFQAEDAVLLGVVDAAAAIPEVKGSPLCKFEAGLPALDWEQPGAASAHSELEEAPAPLDCGFFSVVSMQ